MLTGNSLLQFGKDGLRQYLSKFNSPLIITVYVPNDALNEDFMLIEGD